MTPPGARPLWQRWLRVMMILNLIGAGMVAFLLTRAVPHPISWTLSSTELMSVGALASSPWHREIAIWENTQMAAPLIKSPL